LINASFDFEAESLFKTSLFRLLLPQK